MSTSVSLPNEDTLKQQLTQANPTLSPSQLKKFFPKYSEFTRQQDHFGIWQTTKIKQKNKQSQNKYTKVLLLLSGVAGGGKDTIREKINQLYPGSIFKIITATSRKPRLEEEQAIDYYFYPTKAAFKKAIQNNEFLEWVAQGDRLYGLPKISLTKALSRPEPIIVTHVEMTAWPKVSQFIKQEVEDKPFILKVFIMPQMKYNRYAGEWLHHQRQDYATRLSRTLWELNQAPIQADLIISNHIDQHTPFLEWQTQALLRLVNEIFKPAVKLELALVD